MFYNNSTTNFNKINSGNAYQFQFILYSSPIELTLFCVVVVKEQSLVYCSLIHITKVSQASLLCVLTMLVQGGSVGRKDVYCRRTIADCAPTPLTSNTHCYPLGRLKIPQPRCEQTSVSWPRILLVRALKGLTEVDFDQLPSSCSAPIP